MTLNDLLNLSGTILLTPESDRTITVEDAYTSDLLSDVMANAPEDSVLITLQAHKNTIACATLAGIRIVVLAGHRQAPQDMLAAAAIEKIAVVGSSENQFQLSYQVARLLGL